MKKFVSYIRVSTQQQGKSGLGLDAQQSAVDDYVRGVGGTVVAEFREIETGKGSNALERRPELRAAMAVCKKQGATLLVAKIDRLARNVHFVSGLIESGTPFICCDMPHAGKLELQVFSMMAEHERDQISKRTKLALAQAKLRGVKLGTAGYANLKPNIEKRQQAARAFAERHREVLVALSAAGLSQRRIAQKLNDMGVTTARGAEWSHKHVARVSAML